MGSNSIQIPITLANYTPALSSSSAPNSSLPLLPRFPSLPLRPGPLSIRRRLQNLPPRSSFLAFSAAGVANSAPRHGNFTVGDFMTTKEHLHVVKPTTTVDQGMLEAQKLRLRLNRLSFLTDCFVSAPFTALDFLVEKRITGFPVIDDDWKLVSPVWFLWLCMKLKSLLGMERRSSNDSLYLRVCVANWLLLQVGVVSDYDLLALDSISGNRGGMLFRQDLNFCTFSLPFNFVTCYAYDVLVEKLRFQTCMRTRRSGLSYQHN